MKKIKISICIPVEKKTKYLEDALAAYSKQTYKNFEVLVSASKPIKFKAKYNFARVIADKSLTGDPASKRNKVLRYAKGEIFVFNDDDCLVPANYLANIAKIMKNKDIAACCGPLLTPPNDNFWRQASGAVWESSLGMGGLGGGIHRSLKRPARVVYDFPAANLIVRRGIFESVAGFEPGLYSGEDTKLCLDIYNKYKKGVNYDPKLYAYHYRKPLFRHYLTQIGRYGAQRGWFSTSYPETSFKLIYFIPAFFLAYIVLLPFLSLISAYFVFPLLLYILLIAIEALNIIRKKGLIIGFAAAAGIISTHIYYGYKFTASFAGKPIQRVAQLFKLSKKI